MMKIEIYVDTGAVYYYEVADDIGKAREHVHSIVTTGYRHTPKGTNDLEWFPLHRILKVKVIGGAGETNYKDEARADIPR